MSAKGVPSGVHIRPVMMVLVAVGSLMKSSSSLSQLANDADRIMMHISFINGVDFIN